MSKSSKIILWIVVLIAIALIAWCYFGTTSSAVAPVTAPLSESQTSNQQMLAASSAALSSAPVSGLDTSPSDSSNAALTSDISAISGQSTAMNQDTAAAISPTQ